MISLRSLRPLKGQRCRDDRQLLERPVVHDDGPRLTSLMQDSSPYFQILATFPKLKLLRINTFNQTEPFLPRYQTCTPVASLAAVLWSPKLEQIELLIYDIHSKRYSDKNSNWRHWVIELQSDKTKTYGRYDRFHIVERTEREFETWMERLARAKNEPYFGSSLNRKWKRKGWLKAREWFEQHQDESSFRLKKQDPGLVWALVQRVLATWL